ncbi:MAG: substrate-binding domain-containing protein [bacterium]|nr:substrate-binding domain-containing protein [bacterium]
MDTKNKRFQTIGILSGWSVYHTQLQPFFELLLTGIARAARKHDCNLLIGGSILRHATPSNHVTAYGGWAIPPDISFLPIGEWNTDGLLVVAPLHSKERSTYVQEIIQRGHPVVFVNSGENGSTVYMDYPSGLYQAMQHLYHHGHRSIAFIAGEYTLDGTTDGDEKLYAYQNFVREYGLAADPRLIAYGFHIEPGGAHAMQQILDSGVEFTAVMVSNDESAHGAIETLKRAGRQVPDDVAVVGIDDHIHARARKPLLTTIHNPIAEIGMQAVDLLIQHMRGEVREPRIVRVPASLTIRESCGCVGQTRILESAPALEISLGAPGLTIPHTAREALLTAMTFAVIGGGAFLAAQEVEQLCALLVDSFFMSMRAHNPQRFLQAFDHIFQHTLEKNDTVQPWQEALTVLQRSLHPHPWQQVNYAHQLIHQARAAISQQLEWRGYARMQTQTNQLHQMAAVADKLISTLDERNVVEVVTNDLEPLGIRQGWIALLRETEDDPLGETVILSLDERHHITFRSREFPPPGLVSEDMPYQRMLLPLTVNDRLLGYAIFEGDNLAYCGEIVQHISGALHSIGLYRQAMEGRRLAEEADRLKSRFLSVVSHELRTPLSQIVGLSDLLAHDAAGKMPGNYLDDLKQIEATARHLNNLIHDVLDLSTQQIGQFSLQREMVDVMETLSVPFATGERMAVDKGLIWQVEAPEDLPPVFADRTRLRQVALNLITNAIKFTPSGSITVQINVYENELTFSITDTGIGVPLDQQKVIFEAFHQSDITRDHQYRGLGLGLAISKEIIELHGGAINVYSEPEQGATFYFTLPLLSQEPTSEAGDSITLDVVMAANETAASEPAVEATVKTILIVDDQPTSLELYARMIERYAPHYLLLRARSGSQALNLARRHPVDLMLLDLHMPQMSGVDVLQAMHQDKQLTRIPVVLMTAHSGDSLDSQIVNWENVVMILQKGVFTTEELMHHLRLILTKAIRLRGESLRLVRSAMAFIHTHYSQPLTRDQIARHVAVSQDHLNRCFQQELGLSIMAYLMRYRLSQAKTLLLDGRRTVGDVANATGFASIAYFCRVFRREIGVSPGAYRQKALAKSEI